MNKTDHKTKSHVVEVHYPRTHSFAHVNAEPQLPSYLKSLKCQIDRVKFTQITPKISTSVVMTPSFWVYICSGDFHVRTNHNHTQNKTLHRDVQLSPTHLQCELTELAVKLLQRDYVE